MRIEVLTTEGWRFQGWETTSWETAKKEASDKGVAIRWVLGMGDSAFAAREFHPCSKRVTR
jgi:hypothetical protein